MTRLHSKPLVSLKKRSESRGVSRFPISVLGDLHWAESLPKGERNIEIAEIDSSWDILCFYTSMCKNIVQISQLPLRKPWIQHHSFPPGPPYPLVLVKKLVSRVQSLLTLSPVLCPILETSHNIITIKQLAYRNFSTSNQGTIITSEDHIGRASGFLVNRSAQTKAPLALGQPRKMTTSTTEKLQLWCFFNFLQLLWIAGFVCVCYWRLDQHLKDKEPPNYPTY